MHAKLNPPEVHKPLSNYSHGVLVEPDRRWLVVSGQVGLRPDGSLPEAAEAQIEQAWENVLAVLAAGGMGLDHLVKVTVFLTRAADAGQYRAVRDRLLGARNPASTLVVVAALANPRFVVEIEALAAAAPDR